MENELRLKNDNILRFRIVDSNGNNTGEYLEFDLEDIELPLNIMKAEIEHEKNKKWVKMKFLAIDNKQDKKGKYALSYKEEEKIKVLKEYYEKEMKALNIFLGDGAVEKLLNGRKPYYDMFDDICEELEPIMPIIDKNVRNINDIVREKYKQVEEKVLE